MSRPGSNSCYKFVITTTATWDEAQAKCNGMGAYGVSIDTLEEYIWMLGYRVYHPQLHRLMWTGGYRFLGEWLWQKSGGESFPMKIKEFANGQPDNMHGNQNCLQLISDQSPQGKFDDEFCDQKRNFVCEKSEVKLF